MMRENKVHKFIDGTLTRILEKMDHMVKDYKIFKFNPGMEHRIWTEDDKRRSEKFIQLFERRLKIRRIFRNLESFKDSILQAGNPVKEILLKLNPPNHCIEMDWRYLVPAAGSRKVKFMATCSYSRLNVIRTSRKNKLKLPQTLISMNSLSCQRDE
ncbi:hypothetical protein Tco_1406624, partial [Tanacetum coccineum]